METTPVPQIETMPTEWQRPRPKAFS